MNSKHLFTAIAVVVILVIAFFVYNQSNNDDELAGSNTNINVNTGEDQSNTNTPPNTDPSTNEQTTPDGNDVAVFEIGYDGKAYSPAQMTIKNGDIIVFKNNSTGEMWPASAPHPTHTNYPEFDPKKSIAPGQTWQFKFTKTGEWGFHDHENSSAFGKITVQ